MAITEVKCIHCNGKKVNKYGTQNGIQRYKCCDCRRIFREKYINNGAKPETKIMIIKMSLNGSGIRDISRVLSVSTDTVLSVLKKLKKNILNINPKYQKSKNLRIRLEMDEMWGRVGSKKTPCWLWHAINHDTGEVVAFVLGSRKDEMLIKLLRLLDTINIEIIRVYSDDHFAYHDYISAKILRTGKRNTQKIERKHLTFRTRLKRLARKPICYSKSLEMHKIMVGFLINSLELGIQLF